MITISIEELKKIISALKGILPINFDGMDRLVAVVSYFEETIAVQEKKSEGDVKDGG